MRILEQFFKQEVSLEKKWERKIWKEGRWEGRKKCISGSHWVKKKKAVQLIIHSTLIKCLSCKIETSQLTFTQIFLSRHHIHLLHIPTEASECKSADANLLDDDLRISDDSDDEQVCKNSIPFKLFQFLNV